MAGHIIRGSGERQGPRLRLIDEWINSDRTWCHPSAAEENMEASLCYKGTDLVLLSASLKNK